MITKEARVQGKIGDIVVDTTSEVISIITSRPEPHPVVSGQLTRFPGYLQGYYLHWRPELQVLEWNASIPTFDLVTEPVIKCLRELIK